MFSVQWVVQGTRRAQCLPMSSLDDAACGGGRRARFLGLIPKELCSSPLERQRSAGEQGDQGTRRSATELRGPQSTAGIEPATSRLTGEVTLVYATGNNVSPTLEKYRQGTSERGTNCMTDSNRLALSRLPEVTASYATGEFIAGGIVGRERYVMTDGIAASATQRDISCERVRRSERRKAQSTGVANAHSRTRPQFRSIGLRASFVCCNRMGRSPTHWQGSRDRVSTEHPRSQWKNFRARRRRYAADGFLGPRLTACAALGYHCLPRVLFF